MQTMHTSPPDVGGFPSSNSFNAYHVNQAGNLDLGCTIAGRLTFKERREFGNTSDRQR